MATNRLDARLTRSGNVREAVSDGVGSHMSECGTVPRCPIPSLWRAITGSGPTNHPEFLNNVPVPKDERVTPPELPGMAAEVKPRLFYDGDANVETVTKL